MKILSIRSYQTQIQNHKKQNTNFGIIGISKLKEKKLDVRMGEIIAELAEYFKNDAVVYAEDYYENVYFAFKDRASEAKMKDFFEIWKDRNKYPELSHTNEDKIMATDKDGITKFIRQHEKKDYFEKLNLKEEIKNINLN